MLVPRALLSHISTLEFLRTFEKRERYSPTARASLGTSPVFLKIPACLHNATMHSARLLSFIKTNFNLTPNFTCDVYIRTEAIRTCNNRAI